ncbi:MAG: SET domain-containing protein [Candidatus Babeliales bacterium]
MLKKVTIVLMSTVGLQAGDRNEMPLSLFVESKSSYVTLDSGVSHPYVFRQMRICKPELADKEIRDYIFAVAEYADMQPHAEHREPLIVHYSASDSMSNKEAIFFGENGMIRLSYWQYPRLLQLEVKTDKKLCSWHLGNLTRQHFGLIEYAENIVMVDDAKTEHENVEVRGGTDVGYGVFATKDIQAGEFIGGLYGKFYQAQECMDLPEEYRDHVMQCGDHVWRACKTSDEAVQYLNHSCNPNCGVLGLFDFVAMRDIKAGEEITTDYGMQDDSNWAVPGGKCLCASEQCRGDILPYRNLPATEREALKPFISHWILHKYQLCSCVEK